jgi:uroporphyrinogen-III synthase
VRDGGVVSDGGALSGYRIAVTRPEAGAACLADALVACGAEPVLLPLVRTVPAADPAPLLDAAGAIRRYDWIVMTSATAARGLRDALATAGAGDKAAATRVAVVGAATARVVEDVLGWRVDAMPAQYTGSALTVAMAAVAPLAGARVLWPRAREARDELPRDLLAAGAILDAPEAYRTESLPEAAVKIAALGVAGELDGVTLTSPSAAVCLAAARPPGSLIVAVIGPSTAEAARQHGLSVHVQPRRHTIPDLVNALAEFVRTAGC